MKKAMSALMLSISASRSAIDGMTVHRVRVARREQTHLVVLAHGLMGMPRDLDYLGQRLDDRCCVLLSESNKLLNSLKGVRDGGAKLASEVRQYVEKHQGIQEISFVGNSLGGLYARYALSLLYNASDGTVAGCKPKNFLTIATPHLGVRLHTFIKIPERVIPFGAKLASAALQDTGSELVWSDGGSPTETLLYRMATEPQFMEPLHAFERRRAYANLENDLVVPLGTAAFLPDAVVAELKAKYNKRRGIVATVDYASSNSSTAVRTNDPYRNLLLEMIQNLDSCGWEKVLVNFPGPLPFAHNKICALTRDPITTFLNKGGRFVMQHAATFIQGNHT